MLGEMARARGASSILQVLQSMSAPFVADYCALCGYCEFV